MKTKDIIQFEMERKKSWVKGLGERFETQFIMIAEMPDGTPFYAATIESSISSRFQENKAREIAELTLVKGKGNDKKYLQVKFTDEKVVTLEGEDYFLLFHLPHNKEGSDDYVLVFNKPDMLGENAHYHVFESDAENQDAIALFWLLKDFIFIEKEEE